MIVLASFLNQFIENWNFQRIGKKLAQKQNQYRNQIQLELSRFPSVGLYEGESKEDWEKFVKYLEIVYNDVDGERREIIDRVKFELSKRKDYFDDLLKDLGLDSTSSIRRITNKLKRYIPSVEYKKLQDAIESYNNAETLMKKFQIPSSDIKDKILSGLRKKYQKNECQRRFNEVIDKNRQLVECGQKTIQELTLQVENNLQCQRYEILKKELSSFISEWVKADTSIGKDNIIRGRSFEQKCKIEGVSLILQSLGLNKSDISIHTNISWANCPGEIDIAILDKQMEKVICLGECKARLFDIVQGYKQSGPIRSREKNRLRVNQKEIDVAFDVPCYVITTLPTNDYFLGIESKVKQDLNKYTLEFEFSEVDFNEVYTTLKTKYEKMMSPLSWFKAYSSTNLLVVV